MENRWLPEATMGNRDSMRNCRLGNGARRQSGRKRDTERCGGVLTSAPGSARRRWTWWWPRGCGRRWGNILAATSSLEQSWRTRERRGLPWPTGRNVSSKMRPWLEPTPRFTLIASHFFQRNSLSYWWSIDQKEETYIKITIVDDLFAEPDLQSDHHGVDGRHWMVRKIYIYISNIYIYIYVYILYLYIL